jgi:hypothetical protein
MSAMVRSVDSNTARRAILDARREPFSDAEEKVLMQGIAFSSRLWVGTYDGALVCVWGLVPPTLISDSAYLWLLCTEELEKHKFLFVRKSQIEMEEMLRLYPKIVGVTNPQNESAVRWLKWLGAEFGDLDGRLLPFRIRSR